MDGIPNWRRLWCEQTGTLIKAWQYPSDKETKVSFPPPTFECFEGVCCISIPVFCLKAVSSGSMSLDNAILVIVLLRFPMFPATMRWISAAACLFYPVGTCQVARSHCVHWGAVFASCWRGWSGCECQEVLIDADRYASSQDWQDCERRVWHSDVSCVVYVLRLCYTVCLAA